MSRHTVRHAPAASALHAAIHGEGFAFVRGGPMKDRLAELGPLTDWPAFADSWNRLDVDTYMADGGRYRRRRHATFAAAPGGPIERLPHQPHFQPLDYNPLNGGVERWFSPVAPEVAGELPPGAPVDVLRLGLSSPRRSGDGRE